MTAKFSHFSPIALIKVTYPQNTDQTQKLDVPNADKESQDNSDKNQGSGSKADTQLQKEQAEKTQNTDTAGSLKNEESITATQSPKTGDTGEIPIALLLLGSTLLLLGKRIERK